MHIIMRAVEPVDHIATDGFVVRHQCIIAGTGMPENLCSKEADEILPQVRREAGREEIIRYAYFVFDETIYEGIK